MCDETVMVNSYKVKGGDAKFLLNFLLDKENGQRYKRRNIDTKYRIAVK
jgi:hypothetical protein